MARKDVLLGITNPSPDRKDSGSSNYAMRGATKSMLSSIGELASQAARAEKLIEGAAVVELDAQLVDASFVQDRMDAGDPAYKELREAIQANGQDSPILVRPHPQDSGRYMVIFGHRRLRVAKELNRPVKAVIKSVDDTAHVIAQGQENSARDNLSFIERAVFAQKLVDLGYNRETVQAALSIDNPMLTRMLSVTKRVPMALIDAIGSSKNVGRDRWIDFATLYEKSGGGGDLAALMETDDFNQAPSDEKFAKLYSHLKNAARPKRKKLAVTTKKWTSRDATVTFAMNRKPKKVAIELSSTRAPSFGEWLSERLDSLFEQFEQSDKQGNGD
ncbi:MAG: plasmid partitioning protein RepB [Rhizobiales bacterium]|nr:plasmid partitioning protein RepB [Hyphomicrobiales bacterium]OJY04818.1 MAG: plasmid partitioning protein RepB [Rhizobiales bacterium 63-22]